MDISSKTFLDENINQITQSSMYVISSSDCETIVNEERSDFSKKITYVSQHQNTAVISQSSPIINQPHFYHSQYFESKWNFLLILFNTKTYGEKMCHTIIT